MVSTFFMMQKDIQLRQVLVIDDDFTSLFLARLTLEDMHIARKVTTWQSAEEGLQFLTDNCLGDASQESCPDLILLDINMPVMNGFEFLEQLKNMGQQKLISRVVVALTSSNSTQDREMMQAYVVRHFLVKPITEEKVWETIKTA